MMVRAGFRRSGKKYVLDDENFIVLNWFGYDMLYLKMNIEWGMVPRPLLDYERRSDARRPLNFAMGMFNERIPPPQRFVVGTHHSTWIAEDSKSATELGHELTALLTDVYVPLWREIVHSDGLLAWFDRGGVSDFMFSGPGLPETRELWYVAVHIDDGDPADLRRMIDSIPVEGYPHAKYYVKWWRARLAEREEKA